MLGNALFARLALSSGQHVFRSTTCPGSFAPCCQLRASHLCRLTIVPEGSRKTVSKCRRNAHALRKPSGRHVRYAIAHASPIASPLLCLGPAAHCHHQMSTHYGNQAGGTSDVQLHMRPQLLPHCFAWVRVRTAAIKTPWPSDLGAGRCKQGWGRARLRSPCLILSSWPRRQPWQMQRASDDLRHHLKAELVCGPCCSLQLQSGTRASQAHVV